MEDHLRWNSTTRGRLDRKKGDGEGKLRLTSLADHQREVFDFESVFERHGRDTGYISSTAEPDNDGRC